MLTMIFLSSCSLTSSQVPESTGFWYTFQRNDTLASVAEKFSTDMWVIQRENDIYDANDLVPGMKIFIPGIVRITSSAVKHKAKIKSSKTTKLIWPASGVISSGFGKRHGKTHTGIDITKDRGRKIIAAASGKVIFAGHKNGYGKTIIIDHGQGVKTLYAHNQTLYVKKNTWVRQGKQIAKMGSTGNSSGIHLHFEVIVNGKHHNPLRYLPIR